jgi:hypothetical protein
MLDVEDRLKMGAPYGNISVRKPAGRMLTKWGQDETAYNAHGSSKKKTWNYVDVKGNKRQKLCKALKEAGCPLSISAMTDEIMGMCFNTLGTEEDPGPLLKEFETWREKHGQAKTRKYIHPGIAAFEYGANNGQESSYFGCDEVCEHFAEALDLHEFLREKGVYPAGSAIYASLDNSQTHGAFSADAVRVENFNVWYGGRAGEEVPHDVQLEDGDIGPHTQQGKVPYGAGDIFSFRCLPQDGDPASLSKNAKGGAWQNKQRGLMDVAALLGWYEEGMTAEGKKPKKKWVKGDIVIVKFNEGNKEWFEPFRVKTCESSHKKLNDGANITCQPMKPVAEGSNTYKCDKKTTYIYMSTQLTGASPGELTLTTTYIYMSTLLTGVSPGELKLISGNPSSQDKQTSYRD